MRPYLAILIDSFWEAIGNKVLWALLIAWSLVLAALVPFGFITETSYQLSNSDIREHDDALEKLSDAARGRETKALRAVVAKLSPEFRDDLKKLDTQETADSQQIKPSRLVKELNRVLEVKDLYAEDAFPLPEVSSKREELEPLLEADSETLSDLDLQQLNRELLQIALPREIARARGEQLWIGYGSLKIGEPLPFSRRAIKENIEPLFFGLVIKLGLGVLAILIAIIVTSPIVPDTFRSGSLHLLLSKPISRVYLYLAKFFGGTIFVFVNISYVLIGLYFIAGMRFGFWNSGLLACIPLLVFVFIIFYTVSCLAGLLWGNPIVCIVACMVFWLFCFALGTAHDAILGQLEVVSQLGRIDAIEDDVLSVNGSGELKVWNQEYSVWQPAIDARSFGRSRTFGPVYDADRNQIVAKTFNGFSRGSDRSLSLIPLARPDSEKEPSDVAEEDATDATAEKTEPRDNGDEADEEKVDSATTARKIPRWLSDQGPALPEQLFDLFQFSDGLIAICRGGIFRLDAAQLSYVKQERNDVFGFKVPWLKAAGFVEVTPEGYFIDQNTTASVTTDRSGLIIYSSGGLDLLRYQDKKFELAASTKMDGEGNGREAASVVMNENYCVVARDGLPLTILDPQLADASTFELPEKTKVRHIAWRPGTNLLAIISHTGELLQLDCDSRTLETLSVPFSGSYTTMRWLDGDRLWAGVKPNRAVLLNATTGEIERSLTPQATLFENIFRWVIKPAYYVNPKPAALDNTMTYLLSGNKTQSLDIVANNLETAQVELDIWQPIITNLCFVIVMLGIGCIYVVRKEF